MKIVMAVYNFLVGDIVILTGVVITLLILTVINTIGAFTALRSFEGYLLIVAIIIILWASLNRETSGR